MSSLEPSTVQAIEAAFGEHPSDVLSSLSAMATSLLQLEAMFSYLQTDLAHNAAVPLRARELLAAGQDLAGIAADKADSNVALYRKHLRQAGLLPER